MSSAPFDPYHKWLGIPRRDQPAHHYRLLGIPLYEDDPQVVEAAADRQMAFLRKFQSGEHSADALKLLNEVSRARICLLKAATKAAYDESLRAELAASEPAAPINIDTTVHVASRPIWMSPVVLGGGGALIAVLVGVAVFLFPRSAQVPQPPPVVEVAAPGPAAVVPDGSAKPRENPPTTVAGGSNRVTLPKTAKTLPHQDPPPSQKDKAAGAMLAGAAPESRQSPGKIPAAASSPPSVDPRVGQGAGTPAVVDLLPRVDVVQHRIAGQWLSENRQLISPATGMTRLGVPYVLPDEYDLALNVARATGKRGFGLVFPVQGHPAQLLIDTQNATQSRLGNGVPGRQSEDSTFEGQVLHPDRPVAFLLQVRRRGVSVAADGKEILKWEGDPAVAFPSATNENFSNPKERELMLVSMASSFRVSRLELSPPQSARTPTDASQAPVDLLSKAEVGRDTAQGDWTLKDGVLIGSTEEFSRIVRLNIPFAPTSAEYDLALSINRDEAQGSCGIGLQVQGQQCILLLDTDGQENIFGISNIDGQPGIKNETTSRLPIPAKGLPFLIRCEVRLQALTVEVNGEKVIEWKGDIQQLSAPAHCQFPDPKTFVLAVQEGTFRFNRFTFSPAADGPGSPQAPLLSDAEKSTGMSADAVLQIKKDVTPDASAQDAARKVVRDHFKIEYALAKKAEGRNLEPKISLAKSLMARAESTNDDPAAVYVMLSDAAELAAESGQLALAWEILVALGDRFDSPSLPLMERAAKLATPFAKTADDIAYLGSMYVLLLDEAVRLDDFETATKASPAAAGATRKIPVLKEQLAAYARRVNTLRDAFELAKPAREVLKVNPDDATANLAWGRYVCFYKGDWLTGLPLLAKSSNAALSSLAKREVEQPRELETLLQLGDDWWEVAEEEKDPVKSTIRERAADAWQLALPLASGLQKQALETKVERIFKPTKFFETTGTGQGVSVANPDLNPGPFFTVEFWVATQASSAILLSKREDRRDSSLVIGIDRGRPAVSGRSSSGTQVGRSRVTINDGRWHHVAAVKLGTRLGLFIDGKWAAQTEFQDTYLSGSPWKLGHDGQSKLAEPEAKFCRIRFSKDARYLVSFHPEKTYSKDKGTLFIP